jgi:hypothetical protein
MRKTLHLVDDEVWVLDLALGQERLQQEHFLEQTLAISTPEAEKVRAHHVRLLAACRSIDAKLMQRDEPDPAESIPYDVSPAGLEVLQLRAKLERASQLEQAVRAILVAPGVHRALSGLDLDPRLCTRLAEALEPTPPHAAEEDLMAGEEMMPVSEP